MARGVAGAGLEGGRGRLRGHGDLGDDLDEDGVDHAVAHAGDVDEGGLSAAGAGNEGGAAGDLGDAGGAVIALVLDEDPVAVAEARFDGGERVGGVGHFAEIDGGGSGLPVGIDDGDHAGVARTDEIDGYDDQQDAENGQQNEGDGLPLAVVGMGGGGQRDRSWGLLGYDWEAW
jgi:hypothetical protein